MGIGHSVDTPIRVAPFGITSVISLVDDTLLEKIRKYYSEKYGLPYVKLARNEPDGRAKRITAYLETVQRIVRAKMEAIKEQPFFEANDKSKYFNLLPEEITLKKGYNKLLKMKAGAERSALEEDLTRRMQPGSIDVNIMVKLDGVNFDKNGTSLGDEFSDAKAALRGYARSGLRSDIVFSAGLNKKLFNYMTRFEDFYRDEIGDIKKRIIRFLAGKGLEVHEFRIESGLNCGGHAFPSNGSLLPCLLQEFKEKRELLAAEFKPLIEKYYDKMGWHYTESALKYRPLVTVQGGLGTHGEARRLRGDFGMDLTGWASPFLLVPEATCVDTPTRQLLKNAEEKDLYVSDVSPLQIPFNNVRKTGSEIWTCSMVEAGRPGSACPKQFLLSNTEFTKKPICLASRRYQKRKLEEIDSMAVSDSEKQKLCAKVVEKTCICDHLGNGALVALGIAKDRSAPPLICPGPNIAWFNKTYTLKEMVDHIYGRGPSLVSSERPHMFAKEIVMYVDHFEKQVARCTRTSQELKTLEAFKNNLEEGMDFCLAIARKRPYEGENLVSIPSCVKRQRARLRIIYGKLEKKVAFPVQKTADTPSAGAVERRGKMRLDLANRAAPERPASLCVNNHLKPTG
jgi:hypothetical protein